MKTRLQGVAILAICALAMHRLYLLVHILPRHEATPLELLLALVVVLTGVVGAAMAAVGPSLFRVYQWPPQR